MKRTAHDKYIVQLPEDELQEVQTIIKKGVSKARTITRARILEAVHAGKLDKEICSALGTVRSTAHDTRKKYVEGGLQKALYDANHPGKARKLSGEQEAEVIAIACTDAPKGYVRWTLSLLKEEVHKKLDVTIGTTAIWKILLRNNTKPWLKKNVVYSESYS
jgi:transposase